jgi:hypothetical protein
MTNDNPPVPQRRTLVSEGDLISYETPLQTIRLVTADAKKLHRKRIEMIGHRRQNIHQSLLISLTWPGSASAAETILNHPLIEPRI